MDIAATVDLKGGFSGSLDFLNITNRSGIVVVTLTGAQSVLLMAMALGKVRLLFFMPLWWFAYIKVE